MRRSDETRTGTWWWGFGALFRGKRGGLKWEGDSGGRALLIVGRKCMAGLELCV